MTPTPPPHASDRVKFSTPNNSASVHPRSTYRIKPWGSVKIITAANRSRSPDSRSRSEDSDVVIAARSFQNSFGDNSFLNVRSLSGLVMARASRAILFTKSHVQCVYSNFHAPRENSTADDQHLLLCCEHSSALKGVPSEDVHEPLRETATNSYPRDSIQVHIFASRAFTSRTLEPVADDFRNSDLPCIW